MPIDGDRRPLVLLEEISVARDRAPLWMPFLDKVISESGALGGEITTGRGTVVEKHAAAALAFREWPLVCAGQGVGWLSLSFPSESAAAAATRVRQLVPFLAAVLYADTRDAGQRDFVHGAAHDVRGGVSRACAVLQLVARGLPENHEHRTIVTQIIDELLDLEKLIRELASYARAGANAKEPVPVSVRMAVDTVRWNLKPELQSTGRELGYVGDDQSITTREDDLVDVIQRLSDNSLKFGATHISVSAAAKEDKVLITVADDGPGLEPGRHEDIFQPFKRMHSRRYPGHGLGLATCRRLVTALGGKIWAEPTSSGGARINVLLPQQPLFHVQSDDARCDDARNA